MPEPEVLLLVRFKTALSFDEVTSVMNERADEFRALDGLQQKYYLEEPTTGEYAGLYMWDSQEALEEYRESELRATIADAYQTEGQPRIEVYRVITPLRTNEQSSAS